MKRSFFQAAVVSILLDGCTTWTLTKTVGEEAWRQLYKNVKGNIEQVLASNTPQSTNYTVTYLRSRKLYKLDEPGHAGHCWRSKDEIVSDVLLWTPAYGQSKAGRPVRTYIQQLCDNTGCNPEDLSEAMNDRETWRERGSGISVLAARHDNDDDISGWNGCNIWISWWMF